MKVHLGVEMIRADIERTKGELERKGKSDKIKQKGKRVLKAVFTEGKKVETHHVDTDELPARFRYEETIHPRRPE